MTRRLTTIVSGAAPGADRGAIEAGIELGLRVQGWHTELEVRDAPPAYLENAKSTLSPRMRARLNVQDSDGTLILSVAPAVPSHALYADEACEHQRKASLHVVLPAGGRSTILDDVRKGVLNWLREEKIHVLHVTGPTEREEPGVQRAVKDALVWIFEDEDEIERPVAHLPGCEHVGAPGFNCQACERDLCWGCEVPLPPGYGPGIKTAVRWCWADAWLADHRPVS